MTKNPTPTLCKGSTLSLDSLMGGADHRPQGDEDGMWITETTPEDTRTHLPVDLEHITASVLADLAEEAEESGVSITYDPSTALVMGDPLVLRELVTRLSHNAIRHNAPGGWVLVTTSTTNAGATLQIENTGAPISAAAIETLRATTINAPDAVVRLDPRQTGGAIATVTFGTVAFGTVTFGTAVFDSPQRGHHGDR